MVETTTQTLQVNDKDLHNHLTSVYFPSQKCKCWDLCTAKIRFLPPTRAPVAHSLADAMMDGEYDGNPQDASNENKDGSMPQLLRNCCRKL